MRVSREAVGATPLVLNTRISDSYEGPHGGWTKKRVRTWLLWGWIPVWRRVDYMSGVM
jgi:hypothetical protein